MESYYVKLKKRRFFERKCSQNIYLNNQRFLRENSLKIYILSKEFLDKYGFFELIGPTGHFLTSDMALWVNYLDKNSYYPWHNHEAEELYFIVAGEAKFESESEKPKILRTTDTRFHKSYEAHRITTTDSKILSFVIWKNKYENVSKILDSQNS